jgi:hypothetical protein
MYDDDSKSLFSLVMLIILITFFISSLGFLLGRFYPSVQVYISDKKITCEEKGGKYNYFWASSSQQYLERCDNLEREIKL